MTHWRLLSEIKTYLKPSRNDELDRSNRYHTTQNIRKEIRKLMMTALEAKLTAHRNKTNGYFHIAEKKIEEAAMFGNTECAIEMSEMPDGTIGMIYELASILNELGYQAIFFVEQKTLGIYWGTKKKDIVMNIVDEYIDEEE